MKIFSIKRMIGLAAVGGAVAYARKNGGFKNVFNQLMTKKDELLAKVNQTGQNAQDTMQTPAVNPVSSYGKADDSISSSYNSGYGGTNGLNRR